MKVSYPLFTLLLIVPFLISCNEDVSTSDSNKTLSITVSHEESAKEGVQAIIDLYQTKDFNTLLRERYSEIYKAEAAGKVDVLIDSFSKKLSREKVSAQVIQMYQKALNVQAEILENTLPRETETNKMAIFKLDNNSINLYLQKTGKWGFHM